MEVLSKRRKPEKYRRKLYIIPCVQSGYGNKSTWRGVSNFITGCVYNWACLII